MRSTARAITGILAFRRRLKVDLTYYRSGQDIFFNGSFSRSSSRGAAAVVWRITTLHWTSISILCLTPDPAKSERGAEELHPGRSRFELLFDG